MLLAACVARPETPPTVVDAKLSTDQIDPGDSFNLSFTLNTDEYDKVERVYIRGLPKNSVLAGTTTELAVPESPVTAYDQTITLQMPAADGLYDVAVVVDYGSVTFSAPAGILEVNDIPSQVTYSQFVPGSHAAEDCYTPTRLLELQYTVFDENGDPQSITGTVEGGQLTGGLTIACDDGTTQVVSFTANERSDSVCE